MSELSLQYLAFGNMIALAISSLFYGIGGMPNGRVFRRFASPAIIFVAIVATSLFLHKWSFWILAALPLLIVRNCLGYSADHGMPSWVKRALISLMSVATGVILCIGFSGGWWLLIVHGIVSLSTVLFALKSPIVARMEETIICVLLNAVILCYAFL